MFTKIPIEKGTFICRYIGELITKDEEENRVKKAIQEAQNENSFERVDKLVTEFSVVAYNVRCMFMFVHGHFKSDCFFRLKMLQYRRLHKTR